MTMKIITHNNGLAWKNVIFWKFYSSPEAAPQEQQRKPAEWEGDPHNTWRSGMLSCGRTLLQDCRPAHCDWGEASGVWWGLSPAEEIFFLGVNKRVPIFSYLSEHPLCLCARDDSSGWGQQPLRSAQVYGNHCITAWSVAVYCGY